MTNKEKIKEKLIKKLDGMGTEEMAILLKLGTFGCSFCPYDANGGNKSKCTRKLCLEERKKWLEMEWKDNDDFNQIEVGILTPRARLRLK